MGENKQKNDLRHNLRHKHDVISNNVCFPGRAKLILHVKWTFNHLLTFRVYLHIFTLFKMGSMNSHGSVYT